MKGSFLALLIILGAWGILSLRVRARRRRDRELFRARQNAHFIADSVGHDG